MGVVLYHILIYEVNVSYAHDGKYMHHLILMIYHNFCFYV